MTISQVSSLSPSRPDSVIPATAEVTLPPSPPPLPSLSIIIPIYNHLPKVMRCLNSLSNTVDWTRTEVLAQDDASPEYDLREVVGFPPYKVERNEQNLGFIGNVNEAAKRARGDYLCLLNQDTKALHPGWADYMLTCFVKFPNVGIVGPKLLFPNGSIQSCGGLYDMGKGPFHRYLGWKNAQDWRVNNTMPVSWTTGGCLMIRRDDFWRCGGLDEDRYTRAYFEDVDLCCKIRYGMGKQIVYCAEAVLEHDAGSTGGNPYFRQNSIAFHKIWDSFIVPDVNYQAVDY